MHNSSILSSNNLKRTTLHCVPWRLCSKGRPNMEDLILQWAISAGMILAGIVAALLIGYLIFLAAAAITVAIIDG